MEPESLCLDKVSKVDKTPGIKKAQKTKDTKLKKAVKEDLEQSKKFSELLKEFKQDSGECTYVSELDLIDTQSVQAACENVRFEHNRKMLTVAYKSVKTGTLLPPCCNAQKRDIDQCASRSVSIGQSCTPLVGFLLPTELEVFDETGELPHRELPCLLCLRREHKVKYLVALATNNTCSTVITATMRNYCNIDGGYKREHMIPCFPELGAISKDVFGIVDFEPERLSWCTHNGVLCIDESRIMYTSQASQQQSF